MALRTQSAARQVKSLLSADRVEAKRRVLNLYRAWYRQVPAMVMDFDVPKSQDQLRQKIREEFLRHKQVTDLRIIDMLVVKGQMDLQEIVNKWKTVSSFMFWFKETEQKKPSDFLGKFLAGHE